MPRGEKAPEKLTPFYGLPAREEIRRRLALEEEALVLVVVANLIPYKGHMDLLAALDGIRHQLVVPWRLLCVEKDTGQANHLYACSENLNLNGNVRWLGERDDVFEILHASDIGIMCSHQEGFSNSVIEGMAAELPMIVTDVGGNAEAVSDGVTGLIVPPRDPKALGDAISRLAIDFEERKKMGREGRIRVAAKFSFLKSLGRYERL